MAALENWKKALSMTNFPLMGQGPLLGNTFDQPQGQQPQAEQGGGGFLSSFGDMVGFDQKKFDAFKNSPQAMNFLAGLANTALGGQAQSPMHAIGQAWQGSLPKQLDPMQQSSAALNQMKSQKLQFDMMQKLAEQKRNEEFARREMGGAQTQPSPIPQGVTSVDIGQMGEGFSQLNPEQRKAVSDFYRMGNIEEGLKTKRDFLKMNMERSDAQAKEQREIEKQQRSELFERTGLKQRNESYQKAVDDQLTKFMGVARSFEGMATKGRDVLASMRQLGPKFKSGPLSGYLNTFMRALGSEDTAVQEGAEKFLEQLTPEAMGYLKNEGGLRNVTEREIDSVVKKMTATMANSPQGIEMILELNNEIARAYNEGQNIAFDLERKWVEAVQSGQKEPYDLRKALAELEQETNNLKTSYIQQAFEKRFAQGRPS